MVSPDDAGGAAFLPILQIAIDDVIAIHSGYGGLNGFRGVPVVRIDEADNGAAGHADTFVESVADPAILFGDQVNGGTRAPDDRQRIVRRSAVDDNVFQVRPGLSHDAAYRIRDM